MNADRAEIKGIAYTKDEQGQKDRHALLAAPYTEACSGGAEAFATVAREQDSAWHQDRRLQRRKRASGHCFDQGMPLAAGAMATTAMRLLRQISSASSKSSSAATLLSAK